MFVTFCVYFTKATKIYTAIGCTVEPVFESALKKIVQFIALALGYSVQYIAVALRYSVQYIAVALPYSVQYNPVALHYDLQHVAHWIKYGVPCQLDLAKITEDSKKCSEITRMMEQNKG